MATRVHCFSFEQFMKEVRDFTALGEVLDIEVGDIATQLLVGVTAEVQTPLGAQKTNFTIPLVKFKEGLMKLPENEYKAINKFYSIRVEYNKCKADYLNYFTKPTSLTLE